MHFDYELVVTVYGREGCGKCQSAHHKLQHVLEKLPGQFSLGYVDCDSVQGDAETKGLELSGHCARRFLPYIIFRRGEEVVHALEGVVPTTDELIVIIKRYSVGAC